MNLNIEHRKGTRVVFRRRTLTAQMKENERQRDQRAEAGGTVIF
jgi:hypothetical protein